MAKKTDEDFDEIVFIDQAKAESDGSRSNALPDTRPKSEVLEEHWLEFLLYIKNHTKKDSDGIMRPYEPVEEDFWDWWLQEKL